MAPPKLSFERNIDGSIGKYLCNILSFQKKFVKQKSLSKIPLNKIMILKLNAIGDAVLSLPMIDLLKKNTNAQIVVVCGKDNFPIYNNQKFIDKLIVFDITNHNPFSLLKQIKILKKEKPDLVIDTSQSAYFSAALATYVGKYSIGFMNKSTPSRNKVFDKIITLNPKKHMVFCYIDLIKPLKLNCDYKNISLIRLNPSQGSMKKINQIIDKKYNYIGIHPSNNLVSREWPKEKYIELIKYLINAYKNTKIILISGSKIEKTKVIDLINCLPTDIKKYIIPFNKSINDLIAIMTKLDLFIGNDGGPMHIAAAMGVPTIGLFGSDSPVRYAPFSKNSISLYKKIPCNPCHKAYLCEWPICDNPICLKEIKLLDVKKAISKLDYKLIKYA